MGKYDNLPTMIVGLKQEIARKEEETSALKDTLKVLEAKLPKKAKKAEKVVKEEDHGED